MILIQSIDGDVSTDSVIKWLLRYRAEFRRLNDVTNIKDIQYLDEAFIAEFDDGSRLDFNDIKAYWYRRGQFKKDIHTPHTPNKEFNEVYQDYLIHEHHATQEFLLHFLKNGVLCIGDSTSCVDVNKNIVLLTAKECGLKVPDFIITTQKSQVEKFLAKCQSIITKPIHGALYFGTDDFWYPTYTEEVNDEFLQTIPSRFQPTLFQKKLEKKYEIRTFYLMGEFYSMAIFSQRDSQTKTDFRVYNDKIPNRNVPFKLPKRIENRLDRLMKLLRFESGSIDIVYTINNEFCFLEVNPIGQFGMVSYPCNYNLEQKIATKLSKAHSS